MFESQAIDKSRSGADASSLEAEATFQAIRPGRPK